MKKAKGCAMGLLLGTLLRTVTVAVTVLSRLLAKILMLFGLWIPLIYAIIGIILYYGFGFNPFDFSIYSSLYLSGAVACVVCCMVISIRNIIIRPAKSIYDGFRHPLWEKNREKNIEKEEEEFENYVLEKRNEKLSPPEIDDFISRKYRKKNVDYLPPSGNFRYYCEEPKQAFVQANAPFDALPQPYFYDCEESKKEIVPALANGKTAFGLQEKPSVYFSKLEPELLVHEYNDRFELFRIERNRSVLDRVEYK